MPNFFQTDLKRTVYDWIIETKKHTTPAHSLFKPEHISDLHYFLDMDMSVLGWPKLGKAANVLPQKGSSSCIKANVH